MRNCSEEVKISCSSANAMNNSGKEALAKRLRIAKRIEDCDGVRDCCTCEEILDGKEIEYSEVAKIGKLVKDNRKKIKAGESDEEFLRRGLAKVSRIEKQSRIAKKKNTLSRCLRYGPVGRIYLA